MRKIYLLQFFVFIFLLFNTAIAQTDEPCGATTLTVGANGNCTSSVQGCINPPAYTNSTNASSGVTLPANTCGGFTTTTLDFWYKAVVPASGRLTISVTDGGSGTQVTTFWDMALYTSSNPTTCTGSTFTQIGSECATGVSPNISVTQTAGTVVYIRMWREAISAQTANRCYTICAIETPTNPPACTTLITPANGATNVSYASGIALTWAAAAGASSYDIYFGTTTTPTLLGNTGSTATTISITGATPNTLYYWYVVPRNIVGAPTTCSSIMRSFTTGAVPAPPVNDECATAIAISPYSGTVNGTTISGTASAGISLCATDPGTPDEDVWYKFTALQNGAATITVVGGFNFDAVLQAFSGTCASLTQLGTCTDATIDGGTEIMNLTGLVAGQTYYLRVYDWSSGAGDNFTITLAGVALPVQVANFKGEKQGTANVLSWTTFLEQNNSGFELERSVDGINFSSLSFIASKATNGNSTTAVNYAFTDARPFSGNAYYRLKQVDKDGKFSLSNIVLLKGLKATQLEITSIYPNPTQAELKVVIGSPSGDKISLVITDLAGKVIMQKSTQVLTGDNLLSLDVKALPSGSYLIKAICANGCDAAVSKFVKQ